MKDCFGMLDKCGCSIAHFFDIPYTKHCQCAVSCHECTLHSYFGVSWSKCFVGQWIYAWIRHLYFFLSQCGVKKNPEIPSTYNTANYSLHYECTFNASQQNIVIQVYYIWLSRLKVRVQALHSTTRITSYTTRLEYTTHFFF